MECSQTLTDDCYVWRCQDCIETYGESKVGASSVDASHADRQVPDVEGETLLASDHAADHLRGLDLTG